MKINIAKLSICLLLIYPFQMCSLQKISSTDIIPVLTVSLSSLNFNRCTKNSSPSMKFIISNFSLGTLNGKIKCSSNWIKLSSTIIEDNLNEIVVYLDLSELTPNLYIDEIEIESNGGNFILPVRVDLVEKKTINQFIWDNPRAIINSKPTILVYPSFVHYGIGFVPLRVICESFGATVTFDRNEKNFVQKVNVEYKDLRIQFIIDQKYMIVNNLKVPIDKEPEIRYYQTFIPFDAIKDAFGADVQTNSKHRMVTFVF